MTKTELQEMIRRFNLLQKLVNEAYEYGSRLNTVLHATHVACREALGDQHIEVDGHVYFVDHDKIQLVSYPDGGEFGAEGAQEEEEGSDTRSAPGG